MSEPVRCLLNGNDRIGRLVLRYSWDDPLIQRLASVAFLMKYDSVHGTWNKEVTCVDDNTISIDGKLIRFTQHKILTDLDLSKIEMVMECTGTRTGKFLTTQALQPYLDPSRSLPP